MSKTDKAGYFSADDMIWRVSRELVMMLGGGRALLLQVAHPLVAAGVAGHSDYRENPWGRLERTMDAVWSIVFGTREQADLAGAAVRRIHSRVNGRLADRMGPFPAGTTYSALDPALLMWVHGTLVDTALLVYERWVGPLSEREKASYYEDMKVVARVFGTPESAIPETMGDFERYMDERLASEEICVTDTAREIAGMVFRPPLPTALRPAVEVANLVTAGLLPPKLRAGYAVAWDPARRAGLAASRRLVRRLVLPLTPDILRSVRAARRAEGRRTLPLPALVPAIAARNGAATPTRPARRS